MKWWLGGFVALLCQAQQELPPDLALLTKIKVKVAQNLKQLPNYTCTETIERWVRRSTESKPELVDTVHVEVAYVEGRELFGMAGTGKIDQAEIKKLVHGTIGQGGFATKVKEILLGPAATFHYEGHGELGGQPAEIYAFHVPRLVSGERIITRSGSAVVGYRGRFWVDANSLDLIRLELAADDIPSVLQLSAASEWIAYRSVQIGVGTFLLPQSSELSLVDVSGVEAKNGTSYQACRQFVAESTISFTEVPGESGGSPLADARGYRRGDQPGNQRGEQGGYQRGGQPGDQRGGQPVDRRGEQPGEQRGELGTAANLPDEFTVDISLETPIDSDSASDGDAISASLRQSIKVDKNTVAPKGAKLSGQIKRFENQGGAYSLDLTFNSLDFKDGHADLSQRTNEVLVMVTSRVSTPVSSVQGVPMEQVTDTPSPLVFKTKHLKLGRGTHLILRSKK